MIAFSYYGGKVKSLPFIMPLLPASKTFIEPFGGGATVLLNRRQSKLEVLNDLNRDVANFFQVLREDSDELPGISGRIQ